MLKNAVLISAYKCGRSDSKIRLMESAFKEFEKKNPKLQKDRQSNNELE